MTNDIRQKPDHIGDEDWALSQKVWKLDDELCRFMEGREQEDFNDLYASFKRIREHYGDKAFMMEFWYLMLNSRTVEGFIGICNARLTRNTLADVNTFFNGMDKKAVKLFQKLVVHLNQLWTEIEKKKGEGNAE